MTAKPEPSNLRLGLCCQFSDQQSIRFRTTTARYLSTKTQDEAWQFLVEIVRHNLQALQSALALCDRLNIRAFRITSKLLPLATHPCFHYRPSSLPEDLHIILQNIRNNAHQLNIRLSFHPDPFVLLGSDKETVTLSSLEELNLHGQMAERLGADVINIHGGGSYGDKAAALQRLVINLERLTPEARSRLTLENDDRIYTPSDLFSLCRQTNIPLVYDVHHHRCHGDTLSVEEATDLALATWNREPLFHISSPRDGWKASNPRVHADWIDLADFPRCWLDRNFTVDVEARQKEQAIVRLQHELNRIPRHPICESLSPDAHAPSCA